MKVRQHIPDSWDSASREAVAEVDSLEELLALEFVDRWTADPHFYRFSVSWNFGGADKCYLLMAEMDEGKKWWVVAYLSGETDLLQDLLQHLPEWTGGT